MQFRLKVFDSQFRRLVNYTAAKSYKTDEALTGVVEGNAAYLQGLGDLFRCAGEGVTSHV